MLSVVILSAAFLVLVISAVVFWNPGNSPVSRLLEVSQPPEKADVIVVPSGDDAPRLAKAAELYRDGYAPRILTTGFHHSQDQTEILCKRNGIPETALIIEPDASSTYENATLSAPLLEKRGARTVILVTSWYHSRRLLRTFRRVTPGVRFISVPTRRASWPVTRKTLNAELLKLCYYGIRHGVSPW